LDVLGLDDAEQLAVFSVVAAVLKLGNVGFTAVNNIDGTEGCALHNEYGQCDVTGAVSGRQWYGQCDVTGAVSGRQWYIQCDVTGAVSGRQW
jgi:hypothetical protein